MYIDNIRNRTLAILLSLGILSSLSFNIRQLSDVDYYRRITEETQTIMQESLKTLVPIIVTGLSTSSTKTEKVKLPVNETELRCMSENIYFEAGTQSLVGKIAVGQVVLNRMKSSKWPRTACGVVNQRTGDVCQFSWTCQERPAISDQRAWKQSQQIAYDLLSTDRRDSIDIIDGATHFHSTSVRPGWNLRLVTKIDDHLFYK